MSRFLAIIRRELKLAIRQGADASIALMFFVVVVALFPLGVGPEPSILERISGGVVWIGALLAAMLSLDRLFQTDYEDGSLDLLVLTPWPLEFLVLAKCLAHWLVTGLPIMLVSPLLGLLLHMNTEAYLSLLAAMALGTPVLSLIGAVGASLVLGARRAGVLVSLLILPLTVPVLIFGVAAVEAAAIGQSPQPHLMLLGALLLASIPLCPLATAAALRQAVS
ncbi:heme exporter protein CcmB [Alphaproteobacteria bacterium]|nr:heme exporter protein CcmB [Alphaproteobacteria bacterium]